VSEVDRYITDEMRQKFQAARSAALQHDLRVVAARIRNEAPDGTADFQAGIAWAALLVENIANQLTT
jgi:hypothetical protein